MYSGACPLITKPDKVLKVTEVLAEVDSFLCVAGFPGGASNSAEGEVIEDSRSRFPCTSPSVRNNTTEEKLEQRQAPSFATYHSPGFLPHKELRSNDIEPPPTYPRPLIQ